MKFLTLLLLGGSLIPAHVAAQPRGLAMPGARTGGDRFVSPAVVATTIAHYDNDGRSQLDLLVLWRGTPGWFLRAPGGGGMSMSGQRGAGSGPGADIVTSGLRYGTTSVRLTFDVRARTVAMLGRSVALGDANVILVDHVDAPSGAQVIETRRVDASGIDALDVLSLLRQSRELLDYLRCDAHLDDPSRREQMELVCAQVFRRCDARLANPALQQYLDASCRESGTRARP